MPDMLVKLYDLPALEPILTEQKEAGVEIRRALPLEKHLVVKWVAQTFEANWASDACTGSSTGTSQSRLPVVRSTAKRFRAVRINTRSSTTNGCSPNNVGMFCSS